MNVIYILIPIAMLFVVFGLTVFFWAVRKGQFEDLDKQGFSILFDDNGQKSTKANSKANTSSNNKPPKE
ncbi:cbb3-type cytochrome oxidase assembly protein CcoS [Rheinheimera salexigens]|uniref:Cytochrome oxidase maturation protein, cbb3-type n=1 Tax=Rheinheimera salexigens TaxID=1628148 RepID=A0A1E7Q6N1_9GAMM|nr:cbb3-type cytochrome oxidase assembly protein CcoS [Rheinheimera salexigens]OEY69761.1 cytochrome oxidase maturation protein, cbb3-type [Rheinheimera salexigens]